MLETHEGSTVPFSLYTYTPRTEHAAWHTVGPYPVMRLYYIVLRIMEDFQAYSKHPKCLLSLLVFNQQITDNLVTQPDVGDKEASTLYTFTRFFNLEK